MSRGDPERDKAATREMILKPPPVRASGKSWLRHGGGSGGIDHLLLTGATMEQLCEHRGAVDQHLKHLKEEHDLLVTRNEQRLYTFDRRHLGIVEPGKQSGPADEIQTQVQPTVVERQEVEPKSVEHVASERRSLLAFGARYGIGMVADA